jgi:hypothetical protein
VINHEEVGKTAMPTDFATHLLLHQPVASSCELNPTAAHNGAVNHEPQGIQHVGLIRDAAVILLSSVKPP